MNKKIIYAVVFFLCLAVPLAAHLIAPDRTFSDNENRTLAKMPRATAKAVFSGKYQSDLETYLADQFPLRDGAAAAVSAIRKAAGRRDIGGAYIGRGGYYPEVHREEDLDREKYAKNLALIKKIGERSGAGSVKLMLVPCAGSVMRDKLPPFASSYDPEPYCEMARDVLPGAEVIDLCSALREAGDGAFYRTDHHWSAAGVLAAYRALTRGAGAYSGEPELFSDDFLGTTYSKVLDPAAAPDEVYIFPVADSVTAEADGREIPVYDADAATRKDKYTVFFGGNYGTVTVTGGTDNGKVAVVVKDSFANSLAPLLTADYETVILVDPRYFAGSFDSVTAAHPGCDLIFLFEISGLCENGDLAKLLM